MTSLSQTEGVILEAEMQQRNGGNVVNSSNESGNVSETGKAGGSDMTAAKTDFQNYEEQFRSQHAQHKHQSQRGSDKLRNGPCAALFTELERCGEHRNLRDMQVQPRRRAASSERQE